MEEDDTLVGGIPLQWLFEQVGTLLVLPQVEEAPRDHEYIIQLVTLLSWLGHELVIGIRVVGNERFQKERTL